MNENTNVKFSGVTPNLPYEDAALALDWLVNVCGFVERARYIDNKGAVKQAEIYVGDTEVWISGHGEGYWDTQARGPEQYLVVWVNDVDDQWQQVKAAGANPAAPVDQTWGVRNFYVTDPGGYHWGFHKRLPTGYQQVQAPEDGGLIEILAVNH